MPAAFFSSYSAFTQYLDGLGLFSMRLGLDRMDAALNALDLRTPDAAVVHVVGTNGKGSTAGFVEVLARTHGLRTGLYTSPHLVDVRERIRVDGGILVQAEWLEAANAVMARCAGMELTYFELVTVLAVWMFRQHTVDVIVLEAGLGGTHDATCAVPADVVVMTPVGLDHENILGPGILDIARDKSGALGRCPAVVALQSDEVACLFRHVGAARRQPLVELAAFATRQGYRLPCGQAHLECSRATLPEHPAYQVENAALAVLTWHELARQLDVPVDARRCGEALRSTLFAGRFCQHGNFLVDGAHNTMGLQALCTALEEGGRVFDLLIFQSMTDKNVEPAVFARLQRLCAQVCIPALPGNARAGAPADVAQHFSCPVQTVGTMDDALAVAHGRPTLLCGSLYLVGAFYAARPDLFPLA